MFTIRKDQDQEEEEEKSRLGQDLVIYAHLQIAYIAFTGSQGTEYDWIMWVKVGHKLARNRRDFQTHIHARPKALVLNTSLIIHFLKLSPVQLQTHIERSMLAVFNLCTASPAGPAWYCRGIVTISFSKITANHQNYQNVNIVNVYVNYFRRIF